MRVTLQHRPRPEYPILDSPYEGGPTCPETIESVKVQRLGAVPHTRRRPGRRIRGQLAP